jgi:hypothetical protein
MFKNYNGVTDYFKYPPATEILPRKLKFYGRVAR